MSARRLAGYAYRRKGRHGLAYTVTKEFARRALAALDAPLNGVDENERLFFRIYGVTMDHPQSGDGTMEEFDDHVATLTLRFHKRSAGDREFGIVTSRLIDRLHSSPPITEQELIQELKEFYQSRSCAPS